MWKGRWTRTAIQKHWIRGALVPVMKRELFLAVRRKPGRIRAPKDGYDGSAERRRDVRGAGIAAEVNGAVAQQRRKLLEIRAAHQVHWRILRQALDLGGDIHIALTANQDRRITGVF